MEILVLTESGFEHVEIRLGGLWEGCFGTKPQAFIPSLNIILIGYRARHK